MDLQYFFSELWISKESIFQGVISTVYISAISIFLGTILGIIVGLVLTYGNIFLKIPIRIYTDFLRGTPVFVLILACFYIFSIVGIQLTAIQAGIFALALFCSSHIGEIVRGALQSIPKGQTEAALAIGMTFPQIFSVILLPQAMRQILPTWVNTATEIVKASTLLSIIGVVELLLSLQQIISRNFLSLEFYFLGGVLYFCINVTIEKAGRYFERRIAIPT